LAEQPAAAGLLRGSEAGRHGVQYINDELMDGVVDITKPEALVYELDADGDRGTTGPQPVDDLTRAGP
jgi:hypothetical protein